MTEIINNNLLLETDPSEVTITDFVTSCLKSKKPITGHLHVLQVVVSVNWCERKLLRMYYKM